jgi:hypothetical protein
MAQKTPPPMFVSPKRLVKPAFFFEAYRKIFFLLPQWAQRFRQGRKG